MASSVRRLLFIGFAEHGIPEYTSLDAVERSCAALQICSACGVVAPKICIVDGCQHILCIRCSTAATRGERILCPVDKTVTRVSRLAFERNTPEAVMSLLVLCCNATQGCPLRLPLLNMREHWKHCDFGVVCCHKCGNNVQIKRMHEHVSTRCGTVVRETRVASQTLSQAAGDEGNVSASSMPHSAPNESAGEPKEERRHSKQHSKQIEEIRNDIRAFSARVDEVQQKLTSRVESIQREISLINPDLIKECTEATRGVSKLLEEQVDRFESRLQAINDKFEAETSSAVNRDEFASRINQINQNIEEIQCNLNSFAELKNSVGELRDIVDGLSEIKHVQDFVSEFENTILGDLDAESTVERVKMFYEDLDNLKGSMNILKELEEANNGQTIFQMIEALKNVVSTVDSPKIIQALRDVETLKDLKEAVVGVDEKLAELKDLNATGVCVGHENLTEDVAALKLNVDNIIGRVTNNEEVIATIKQELSNMKLACSDSGHTMKIVEVIQELGIFDEGVELSLLKKKVTKWMADVEKKLETISVSSCHATGDAKVCCSTHKALDDLSANLVEIRGKMDELNELQEKAAKEGGLNETVVTSLNENIKSLTEAVSACHLSSKALVDHAGTSEDISARLEENANVVGTFLKQLNSLQQLLEPKETKNAQQQTTAVESV